MAELIERKPKRPHDSGPVTEPSLADVMSRLDEISMALASIPALTAKVNGHESRIAVLENELKNVREVTSRQADRMSAWDATTTVTTSEVPETALWLSGGWRSADEATQGRARLLKLEPSLDSWVTSGDYTAQQQQQQQQQQLTGQKHQVFIRFASASARMRFRLQASALLVENFPHVWQKDARDSGAELALTKARNLCKLLKDNIKEDVQAEFTVRGRDAAVLVKPTGGVDVKIARFSDGRERWDWDLIATYCSKSRTEIVESLMDLDARP
eukprot:6459478-Amphidinium_carterae.1